MGSYKSLHLSYLFDDDKQKYDFNLYGIDTELITPLVNALKDEIQRRMDKVTFRAELAEVGAVPVIKDNQLTLHFER